MARKIQLNTVSRATGPPVGFAEPVNDADEGDNDKAMVLAGAVASMQLPAGTALLVGPPPRYDKVFSFLVSLAQFCVFAAFTGLVLSEHEETLTAHLVSAAGVLVSQTCGIDQSTN